MNALGSILLDARKYRRAERHALFSRLETVEERTERLRTRLDPLARILDEEGAAELRGLLRGRYPELRDQMGGEPDPEHDPRPWRR